MRIALLTESGRPTSEGDGRMWCDRLVRGLPDQEFDVYELLSDARDAPHRCGPVPRVRAVRTLSLGAAAPAARRGPHGRAARRAFLDAYWELTAALATPWAAGSAATPQEDRFANALHSLADLAGKHGSLSGALRGEAAVRTLESVCRTPGAVALAGGARARDLLLAAELLERALRPLSAPWYDGRTLGAADLCHATSGGPAALTGLLAARACGTPLLVTEYGVGLREHYLAASTRRLPPAVRALAASFHRLLAAAVYRGATVLTAGDTAVRRWQEHCGARATTIRTVPAGLDAGPLAAVGEAAERAVPDPGDHTLVRVGRVEPAGDLTALLHAFAGVRDVVPDARLRLIRGGPCDAGHLARCRALAARLFPAGDGRGPVTFEEIGSPGVPTPADAYAVGGIAVPAGAGEGFPVTLVEAMLCGRATVSTDAGAVREVIGGTGLVVAPDDPAAFAGACVELLRDPARRIRLGAAARSRALELFTVERNVAAFRGIYLDLVAHRPARPGPAAVPFARPAEARLPGGWTTRTTHRPPPAGGSDAGPGSGIGREPVSPPQALPVPLPAVAGSERR